MGGVGPCNKPLLAYDEESRTKTAQEVDSAVEVDLRQTAPMSNEPHMHQSYLPNSLSPSLPPGFRVGVSLVATVSVTSRAPRCCE